MHHDIPVVFFVTDAEETRANRGFFLSDDGGFFFFLLAGAGRLRKQGSGKGEEEVFVHVDCGLMAEFQSNSGRDSPKRLPVGLKTFGVCS